MKEEIKVNVDATTEDPKADSPAVDEEIEVVKVVDTTVKEDVVDTPVEAKPLFKTFKEYVEQRRKKEGKKVVLVTTENCASCERMKKMVETFSDVFAKRGIECVTVDKGSVTEVIPEVVKIEDYPTFVFIKKDKVVGTYKGTINALNFIIELKRRKF